MEKGPVVQRLKAWLQEEKGRKIVLILGIAGLVLVFLSGMLPEQSSISYPDTDPKETVTTDQYAARMEERLASIISNVAGAGHCRVMVTLENGLEYRYAQESETQQYMKETSAGQEEKWDMEYNYVFADGGDGKKPLLLTEIQPEIKGVVVVCGGAGRPEVQQRIVEIVTVAMGISSAKVCVVPMS